MADPNNKNLPEGTDTIIQGAGSGGGTAGMGRSGTAGSGATTSTQTNATGGQTRTTDSSDATDALITGGGTSTGSSSGSTGSTPGRGSGDDSGSSSKSSGVRGMISNAGGKLRDESKNRARGVVSQGLERGGATLTNISGLVDDTVGQIEERLGPQYGDYARKASEALNRYADTLQNKDPDELVDDARQLIRKSPSVALAGAAILGFGLVRLIKIGIEEASHGERNRNSDRTGAAR